jgi:hypothetical protein
MDASLALNWCEINPLKVIALQIKHNIGAFCGLLPCMVHFFLLLWLLLRAANSRQNTASVVSGQIDIWHKNCIRYH